MVSSNIDCEQSDDVRSSTALNIERISLSEQNNGIYYVTALHTHQKALELGICVLKFSAQFVVGYIGASQQTRIMPKVNGKKSHGVKILRKY